MIINFLAVLVLFINYLTVVLEKETFVFAICTYLMQKCRQIKKISGNVFWTKKEEHPIPFVYTLCNTMCERKIMHRRFLRCPVHHEHPFLFGSANVAATGRANGREVL